MSNRIETPSKLIDLVIQDLQKGFEQGDYTVLEELLSFLPVNVLEGALSESELETYKSKLKESV